MVIVPVSGAAAHAVSRGLYLVRDDGNDAAPVAAVPACGIDIPLYGHDIPDLADKQPLGICSRAAVLHVHPSRIRQQGLVFFRIGGSDSAAGLPFRLRCRQGQVGKFAVLAQVVLDDFVFGQHVQLVPQELPGFHGGFSLLGQRVDVILEQVYHLQFLENTARNNRGQSASVQIYFDYSFDQETDLTLREWEKIHYQNEMRELIYSAAHRMGAAAFSEGASIFYIMSSRPVLMREFIQNGEYQKILFHGQQTPHNRLWIGIGYGDSPMEAKSRAAMALNHSIADRSGANYIAEDEHQFTEIKIDDPTDHTAYLLHRLHISSSTYEKLKEILQSHDQEITSAQLAAEMGITERSANRLILRLEQENCVTTIGKISGGRGRPARIMKITL